MDTYIAGLIAIAIINGVLFRRRGGGLQDGLLKHVTKFTCKILFSLTIGAIISYNLGTYLGFLIAAPIFIGITHGWGTLFDFGDDDNDPFEEHDRPITWIIGKEKPEWSQRTRYWHNVIGMYLRGLLVSVYSALLWLYFADSTGALYMLLTGLSFGAVYQICHALKGKFRIPWLVDIRDYYTDNAEVIFGVTFTLLVGAI